MNNRIIKDLPTIEIPNDIVVLELKMMQSGKLYLQAPSLHPSVACKMLLNVVIELLFATFQSQEQFQLTNSLSNLNK